MHIRAPISFNVYEGFFAQLKTRFICTIERNIIFHFITTELFYLDRHFLPDITGHRFVRGTAWVIGQRSDVHGNIAKKLRRWRRVLREFVHEPCCLFLSKTWINSVLLNLGKSSFVHGCGYFRSGMLEMRRYLMGLAFYEG